MGGFLDGRMEAGLYELNPPILFRISYGILEKVRKLQ